MALTSNIGTKIELSEGDKYRLVIDEKVTLILPILEGLSYYHIEDITAKIMETVKRKPIQINP